MNNKLSLFGNVVQLFHVVINQSPQINSGLPCKTVVGRMFVSAVRLLLRSVFTPLSIVRDLTCMVWLSLLKASICVYSGNAPNVRYVSSVACNIGKYGLSALVLIAQLVTMSPAYGDSITIREIIKEPIVIYHSQTDPYYFCDEPSDCAAHYEAKINAQHQANGSAQSIELINPQPRMDNTFQGLPFSVEWDVKVTNVLPDGSTGNRPA